jgi:hypothetical protein
VSHRAALLALLLLAPARAGPAPPCRVESRLEPARAFVGQQVLFRQVIVAPAGIAPEWTRPVQFPGFRAEALGTGTAGTHVDPGPGSRVRLETLTALFPARAGRWRLTEARLRCGDAPEQAVPGPEFEAEAPPEAGRPADWTGVVGAVSVAADAQATVVLGQAVRVHVTTRGAANVWDAAPRLALDPPDTERFAREPVLSLDRGERLLAVRHDAFDLVPRRTGTLRVSPIRISFFDPGRGARGGWGAAESEPLAIAVLPAAAPAAEHAAPAARRLPAPERSAPAWLPVAAAALAAALAAVRTWRRARPQDPVRDALREADRAADPDARAAALERGLRAALERSPDPAARSLRAALERLERARFDGSGRGVDLEEIRATLVRAPRP